MTSERNLESTEHLRARVPGPTTFELQCARRTFNDRALTFEHNVRWPALAASFRADVAAIDAELNRRGVSC